MKKIVYILEVLLMCAVLWYLVTTFVFAVTNPGLTQMQIFQHTPRTFILDFEVDK